MAGEWMDRDATETVIDGPTRDELIEALYGPLGASQSASGTG